MSLRDPRRSDGAAWQEVRLRARDQLEPWEVLSPQARLLTWSQRQHYSTWRSTLRLARQARRHGTGRVWVLCVEDAFAGMVELNRINLDGPDSQAEIGYWVDPRWQRQGVGSAGVALACDEAFQELGLFRLVALVQHDNVASVGLLATLGFALEGVARQVLWVGGDWRDHEVWSLLRNDNSGSVCDRWSAGRAR